MKLAVGILALLAPVLLLVAAGADSIQPPHHNVCGISSGSAISVGKASRQPIASSATSDVLLRLSRRPNICFGLNAFPTPAPAAWAPASESNPLLICRDSAGLDPDLNQCWQFWWRTASDPRAPSSVPLPWA